MQKKTNYFSHDSNSRNDAKILAVRIKYGVEGYGIYFMILERLREESNYMCAKDYNPIAFDLRVDTSKVKSIVEDFGLFVFTEDGKYFYSESFMKRMEFKDVKSEKASESANKRWNKKKSMRTHTENDANALRTHTETDASKVKESKVKEKESTEKIAHPLENSNLFRKPKVPTLKEVEEAFMKNGGTKEMAEKFYRKHDSVQWFLNGSPIINFSGLVYGFIDNWRKFSPLENHKKQVVI